MTDKPKQTFRVQIGRDARVYHSATVEAESIEEVMAHVGRHGYAGPIVGEWHLDSFDSFDNLETAAIAVNTDKPEGGAVLKSWDELDGWREGE